MSDTTRSSEPRVIHAMQHAAQAYRLISADEEIIERSGKQIVEACQLRISVERWHKNFNRGIETVKLWCGQHAARVQLLLVEPRSDKIVFFVIPIGETFDFELADQETTLSGELNASGDMGYVEMRQIPSWDLPNFVHASALRVWPE